MTSLALNNWALHAIAPDKARFFSTITKLVLNFALNKLTIEGFLISHKTCVVVLIRSAYIQLGSDFFLLEVLQPSQPIQVMAGWSINLTTLFLGRLSPLRG